MKSKISALLPFFVVCLVLLAVVQVAFAENASPEQKEKAAIYIWSKTDTASVTDAELAGVYREADKSLLGQIRDGLESRGMKVNIITSEQDIAADPTRYILLVTLDKIELGVKRLFGRTAKVKVVYALQDKDRFEFIKRSAEETSVQKWQNCIKKIGETVVADVSSDIAKRPVVNTPEKKQDSLKQAPTGTSPEARLQELDSLKEKGLITEQEYETKRKDILKGL